MGNTKVRSMHEGVAEKRRHALVDAIAGHLRGKAEVNAVVAGGDEHGQFVIPGE